MKRTLMLLILGSIPISLKTLALEQLFPSTPSTYVLDTCMQVCSDLVRLDEASHTVCPFWMDALLGKMVRLQVGIERLLHTHGVTNLHADDLIYLLAMINRVEVAYESVHCDAEYQALYGTLLHTIKRNLAGLLTLIYAT